MNVLMDSTNRRNETNNCDIVINTSDPEDGQLSLCCLCGQTFPSIKSLHMHINVMHEEVADSFNFQSTDGENYNCPLATVESRVSLSSSSEKSVSSNRTPQCGHCMKKFSTLSYLRMHIATVHEGVRAYACSVCEKSYTQKHSLKKHLMNSHSISFSRGILDDTVSTNTIQRKSGQSACSNEIRTFKSRKRLLVNSPIIHSSYSASPSRSNKVDCPVSFETKSH
ncbi:Zinc finger and BTB domain-containing protein 41 [Schistosoma japonicum]|nr:Zinc finger and BTB domain-containing protein 41 [Schistosoma japonicum]